METLLIDFKIIKNKNLQLLQDKLAPIPSYSKNQFLGIIFIVSRNILDYLDSVDDFGKIKYINTLTFLSNIKSHLYIIYDKTKKICEIRGTSSTFLPQITSVIMGNIPNDVLLFIGVDIKSPQLDSIIDSYVKEGFASPFVAKSGPLGYTFENYGLCMLKPNNIVPNPPNMSNEIKYVLLQFLVLEYDSCEVTIKFNQDAIKYLKELSYIGSTVNKNGDISQKEIWFITGSQHLYGEEALKQVASNSQEIAKGLDASKHIPVKIVFKPTVTTPSEITAICVEANSTKNCIGLITWMHTFSL